MLLRLLRVLGYGPVREANNGDQAAAILSSESERFDLVLCDWNLPGMSGFELLELARSLPTGEAIPFIMITGERDRARIGAAREAGVTDYLLKPFSLASLEAKIKAALGDSLPAP